MNAIDNAPEFTKENLGSVFSQLEEIQGLEERMTQQALELLHQKLGKATTFNYEGKQYQLRMRGGKYYLCELTKRPGPPALPAEEKEARQAARKAEKEARKVARKALKEAPDVLAELAEGDSVVEIPLQSYTQEVPTDVLSDDEDVVFETMREPEPRVAGRSE